MCDLSFCVRTIHICTSPMSDVSINLRFQTITPTKNEITNVLREKEIIYADLSKEKDICIELSCWMSWVNIYKKSVVANVDNFLNVILCLSVFSFLLNSLLFVCCKLKVIRQRKWKSIVPQSLVDIIYFSCLKETIQW